MLGNFASNMKTKLTLFLSILGLVGFQMILAQGPIRTGSLDSVLRTIKEPDEKVDAILKFLKEPENQYMEDSIAMGFATRALEISRQTHYPVGIINSMIKLGNFHYRISEYKKAMEYAQQAKELSEDLNLEPELAHSLSLIGKIYTELGDYDQSSQYFFRSLKLFEKHKDEEGISYALGCIGNDFYNHQDYGKALQYFNKALSIAERIRYQSEIKRQYNNMAAAFSVLKKYDTAIVFFQKALDINIKIGDKFGQGINIMNIGYIQMNEGKSTEALQSFHQSLQLFTELDNRLHMAECYLNFGFCYHSTGRVEEGINYFKKALQEGMEHRYYKIISTAAGMLNKVYSDKGETIEAYHYLKLEKLAGDSLFEAKRQILISKFELQYLYEKKEFERRQTQQTKNIIIGIIMAGLMAGLVVLGLLFSRQRLKSKLFSAEKEKIELKLEIKDRELTVNLISLIKKNELLTEISNKLAHLESNAAGKESKDTIAKIRQELRNSINDKMFNEFSQRFKEVHAGFYEKLLLTYPELSQNELKLCAFLRLNMSSKDIAELTGQQVTAIDKARFRLREKLNLANSKTNLVTFLSQI
jgi:tetratricopeptide (TPR) repeat protein